MTVGVRVAMLVSSRSSMRTYEDDAHPTESKRIPVLTGSLSPVRREEHRVALKSLQQLHPEQWVRKCYHPSFSTVYTHAHTYMLTTYMNACMHTYIRICLWCVHVPTDKQPAMFSHEGIVTAFVRSRVFQEYEVCVLSEVLALKGVRT